MKSSLTDITVYLGLYVSLLLAITCNSYLDVHHGTFAKEVLIWALIYAVTLWVGWCQQGVTTDWGETWQYTVFILAFFLSVIIILPIWGFPRGGLFILAAFQAAINCVTTTRRHLYLGLVVAIVMAMFAAAHFRANWTMLFYLIPFLIAVIFTLVADQTNNKISKIHCKNMKYGRLVAIICAVSSILLLASSIHFLTPSIESRFWAWNYGVPASSDNHNSIQGELGYSDSSSSPTDNNDADKKSYIKMRLTPEKMREAAAHSGMPRWQASAINMLADIMDSVETLAKPVREKIDEIWDQLKNWLKDKLHTLIFLIIISLFGLVVRTLWVILNDDNAKLWCITRAEYFYINVLGMQLSGRNGAIQLYNATGRLFSLHDMPRSQSMSAREYLASSRWINFDLKTAFTEMTTLFENARYNSTVPKNFDLHRMNKLYKYIYKNIDQL
jgi:hypothetical protein